MRWLADELISFVKEHGLVQGIDREYITARLKSITGIRLDLSRLTTNLATWQDV